MAFYWIETEGWVPKCPRDYYPLKKVLCRTSSKAELPAYKCPYCGDLYIPYIDAVTAAASGNIRDMRLSPEERAKIKALREARQKKEEQRRREKEKQKELERQRRLQIEAEERRARLEREERERQALEEKKSRLKSDLQACFRRDYLRSLDFFNKHSKGLMSHDEFSQACGEFVEGWCMDHASPVLPCPDRSQCEAIGALEQSVKVTARAGSGKTATMVQRYRFLKEHCGAAPASVLMLAFNKNAAEELREKIAAISEGDMPHIMTFHALAYSIVRPKEELLHDSEEGGSKELSRAVQSIIDDMLRKPQWASKIRMVMLEYFKRGWEEIEDGGHCLGKEEQLSFRRFGSKKVLNGKYVRNHEDRLISNLLFENDVQQSYRKGFKRPDGSFYRPSFTVQSTDGRLVAIEYFPEGSSSTPEERRRYLARNRLGLVAVCREDMADLQSLRSCLLDQLDREQVYHRQLSEDEIWERIKQRAVDELSSTISAFIGRCRKEGLSYRDLLDKISRHYCQSDYEGVFLSIAQTVYGAYLALFEEKGWLDFDALVSLATERIEAGERGFDKAGQRGDLRELSFIMVDEYQDFSLLFYRLLSSIRKLCPTSRLFCVGDDWQAINSFAGSDLHYFKDFKSIYSEHGSTGEYRLKLNYRSKKEIADVSSSLMGTAADRPSAFRGDGGLLRLAFMGDFSPSPEERAVHGDDKATPAVLRIVHRALSAGKDVVLLSRTNDRLPFSFKSPPGRSGSALSSFLSAVTAQLPPEQRSRVSASTTHKYKGKEKDTVIILDAVDGFYPLIHPSWLFFRIFGDDLHKLKQDEKRLFYVALSRARDELYILATDSETASPFLYELTGTEELNWNDLSPFCNGEASLKLEAKSNELYGPKPTMEIKEQLKADHFMWDPGRRSWSRFFPESSFDLADILSHPWAKAADHVLLCLYDGQCRPIASYELIGGKAIIKAQKETALCPP